MWIGFFCEGGHKSLFLWYKARNASAGYYGSHKFNFLRSTNLFSEGLHYLHFYQHHFILLSAFCFLSTFLSLLMLVSRVYSCTEQKKRGKYVYSIFSRAEVLSTIFDSYIIQFWTLIKNGNLIFLLLLGCFFKHLIFFICSEIFLHFLGTS